MEKELSPNEKVFLNEKLKSVKNVGNFIIDSLQKLKGFDFRWTSLISNNPLLFEDLNYFKIKNFINNSVTENEIEAYKNGNLRELFPTLESLLVSNLKYYDRIINYCTMVFLNYVNIQDENFNDGLKKIVNELELTPTKIWCAVFSNEQSTKWELEYGWNIKNLKQPILSSNKTVFEVNYKILYRNTNFSKFLEYNSIRLGVNGFRAMWLKENTSNKKLAQVCQKFTKTSSAISETQLDTIFKYSKEVDKLNERLYNSLDNCLSIMFKGNKSVYSIYILSNEFFIFTEKFSLRVAKDNGKITKDYLANSYECFLAEEYLVPSIKTQIEWSQYKLPAEFEYDKNILKSLLANMLDENYKNVVCVSKILKIDEEEKVINKLTKINFSGVFNNVKINEHFMISNRSIKMQQKVLSKKNASEFIIDKGYYLFGTEEDINILLKKDVIKKKDIVDHYTNYCIPVINHMFDVIAMYEMERKDIINYLVTGHVNPEKYNNDNIMYTSVLSKDEFKIKDSFKNQLMKITSSLENNKKSNYWKVVE